MMPVSSLRGLGQESTALVNAIAAGITKEENVPAQYNNPGAIMNLQTGQLQTYPTLAAGEAALDSQIDLNISRGLTLDQFFAGQPGVYAGYAPAAAGNNPAVYAANVSSWTGIPENVPLTTVAQTYSGSTDTLDTSDVTDSTDAGTSVTSTFTPLTDNSGDSTTDDSTDDSTGLDTNQYVLIGAAVLGVAFFAMQMNS
jgi:hypothetical protein